MKPEAQTLDRVTNAQERLINLLFEGVAKEQISLIGNSVGLNEIETSEFIELLRPSLVSDLSDQKNRTSIDVRFAELIRIGFQTDQSPASVIANRGKTRLTISQLDRTGLTLLKTLAELGFRSFETEDHDLVSDNDLGELGYPTSLRSVSRLQAAKAVLESANTKIEIGHRVPKSKFSSALKIFSATHRIIPKTYSGLGLPHLAIEYRVDSIYVSGILISGKTACLACRELWAIENNSDWLSESIQLLARNDHLDDAASVLMATALAARNVCNFADFGNLGAGNQVEIASRKVEVRGHDFHPGCNCQAMTRGD
jgi:hypothetical protein